MALAADGEGADKSYLTAYALVVLVILFGLASTCRPGGRADKPKMVQQELEEKLKKMSGKTD